MTAALHITLAGAEELHTIPYPENYETNMDEYGADAFANMLDDGSCKSK